MHLNWEGEIEYYRMMESLPLCHIVTVSLESIRASCMHNAHGLHNSIRIKRAGKSDALLLLK